MSSAPDAPAHDAHADHAFTGEPVQQVAPDEPRTPGWLPLLGVALFTTAAVALLVSHGAESAAPAADVAAKPDQAQPVVTAAAVKPRMAPPAAPQPAAPPGTGIAPDRAQQVRKALDALKAKGAASAR
jgi:hypothetical protein